MSAHLRYLSYVARHKWFVLVAGLRTGAPIWQLLVHDWSKFLPSEWFPYVTNFYGDPIPDGGQWHPYGKISAESMRRDRQMRFDRAWLHHQHANPHHWQHWVLREDSGALKVLPMPRRFILEMVADWAGAGRAITGQWEVAKWYYQNRHLIQLHDATRDTVESLLLLWGTP